MNPGSSAKGKGVKEYAAEFATLVDGGRLVIANAGNFNERFMYIRSVHFCTTGWNYVWYNFTYVNRKGV